MYNKTLNDWSRRKQRVLFPHDLNVEGLGEPKLAGSVIECFLFYFFSLCICLCL